jgi:Tol biopolymer transport system component
MEPFFLNHQDNIDSNILYKPTSAKKEKDKERFSTFISKFKSLVESNGAELILILIPSKEQISPRILKETLEICKLKERDIDLQAANRLCAEVAQKEGLTLIDMYEDFRASSLPFYPIDEHLNVLGHKLIASRLVAEYEDISNAYDYLSLGNYSERYPTLLVDSVSLLYQSHQNRNYSICRKQINSNATETLLNNFRELIHPSFSPTQDALLFTLGNQDKLQTEVVLLDIAKGKQETLNDEGCSASIPMFNYDGSLIAFPQWGNGNTIPYIKLYDVNKHKEFARFSDGIECWRPIFSKGDSVVYYISKTTENTKFAINAYRIKNETKEMVLKMPYDIWDIALSPSGKYIAYAGNKDGNWDLFLFNIETQQVTQLTKTIGNEWDPSFGHGDNELFFAGEFGINNGIFKLTIAQ